MIDLHRDQANIICKFFCRCELPNFVDQLLTELLSAKAGSLIYSFEQLGLIVILRIGSFNFKQPVGKEQQDVAYAQLAGRAVVLCFVKDPEHRVGLRSMKREHLSASPCTVHAERGGMSCVCVMQ